jgi:hypothetical protein
LRIRRRRGEQHDARGRRESGDRGTVQRYAELHRPSLIRFGLLLG